MKAKILIIIILIILLPSPIHAIGTFIHRGSPQVVPTEVKAIIVFDGKEETLYIENTFSMNPVIADNQGWVLAFPAKPTVTFQQTDMAMTQIERLTQKQFSKKTFIKKLLFADSIEETHIPPQTVTSLAFIKGTHVFEPNFQTKPLLQWFSNNGYQVPKLAVPIFEKYIKNGWYVIVANVDGLHIEFSAIDSLTINGAHTSPLIIRFPTNSILIPLKFTSIEPDHDSKQMAYSFPYDQVTRDVLGLQDENFAPLLSTPSAVTYPALPLGLINLKIELFVISDHKVTAPNYTSIFANYITQKDLPEKNSKGEYLIPIPKKKMFLTRLYTYKPISHLEDVTLVNTSNNMKVNPHINTSNIVIRYSILILISALIVKLLLILRKK